MSYTVASTRALIGNPVSGAAQKQNGKLHADMQSELQETWIFAGSFMLATIYFYYYYKALR